MSPLITSTGSLGRSSRVKPPAVPRGRSLGNKTAWCQTGVRRRKRLDQRGQISGDDRDIREAETSKLSQNHLNDRHRVRVTQRHERLGQHVGVRAQPRALTPGQ